MKIKIKENALQLHARSIPPHVGYTKNEFKFRDAVREIEGKEIEVDTKYLFNDQYNTVPIEGISENGLRIMQYMVEKVIDDERIGKMRCQYCGKTSDIAEECPECHRNNYLEIFDVNNKENIEESVINKLEELKDKKIGGKQNIRKKISNAFIKHKAQYHIDRRDKTKDIIHSPIFDIELQFDERNRIKDYTIVK